MGCATITVGICKHNWTWCKDHAPNPAGCIEIWPFYITTPTIQLLCQTQGRNWYLQAFQGPWNIFCSLHGSACAYQDEEETNHCNAPQEWTQHSIRKSPNNFSTARKSSCCTVCWRWSNLLRKQFTTGAVNIIDHNPTATTAQTSFCWYKCAHFLTSKHWKCWRWMCLSKWSGRGRLEG